MTRQFILFIGTFLLLTNNLTYGQDANRCKMIASRLTDSLVFPQMMRDNDIEAKLILGYSCNFTEDSGRISFYRKSKADFLNKMVVKHLRKVELQNAPTTCECTFIIDFDILYKDTTKTTIFDTLLISQDSLTHLLSRDQNSIYYSKVEEGRTFVLALDSLYKLYTADSTPPIMESEKKETPLRKEFGFRSLKASKDSIAIRIWDISESKFSSESIYQLGFDSKGNSYAKKYSGKEMTWDKLKIDDNELRQVIIPSLIKLPVRPIPPVTWISSPHQIYHMEIWIDKKYRHYTITTPDIYARDYNSWIDKVFEDIMVKITSR